MNKIIETGRLILRQFEMEDASFIIELVNTPGWIKFIGDKSIKTEVQAREYLRNGPMKSYHDNGFGLALVELKTNKKPIGMCGLLKRDTISKPDIGFAFLPKYTGQGYAYESAAATMEYAQKKLGLKQIVAITLPENKASIRLLEKLGMQLIRDIQLPNNREMLLLYGN